MGNKNEGIADKVPGPHNPQKVNLKEVAEELGKLLDDKEQDKRKGINKYF